MKATASKTAKKAPVHGSDESRMQKIADSIQSTAEKLRDKVGDNVHDSGVAVKVRGVGVSIALVKLQHSLFDRSFKALARLEKYSDKLVKRHIQGAQWMPNEGKDIVKEWSQMLNDGRVDFQKTVDKSYDLLKGYLERIREEQASTAKKKPASKPAAAQQAKSAMKTKSAVKKVKRVAATA